MDHASMEAGKADILVCRSKLDKTLMSHDLSNDETLCNLVKNQLLQSSNFQFEGYQEDVVETRSKEVSNLLSMLRSASSINYERSKSSNESDRGWKLKEDNEEYRVMHREGPAGTPFHNLLVEGYVDAPLDTCLCISLESSLYKKWWPQFAFPSFRVLSSDCLKRLKSGEQICSVRMKLPWPLSVREALVKFSPFEYFQEDLVVVLLNSIFDSKTIDKSTHGLTWEEIANADSVVRIDVVGGIAQQKVSAKRTYVRVVANIDVKLDFLPPVLINFISRQIIGSGFKLFKKEVGSVSNGNDNIFDEHLKDPFYSRIREALYSRNYMENLKSSLQAITCQHNAEETIQGDDFVVYSESKDGRFKVEVSEIEELGEDHAKDRKSVDNSARKTRNGIVEDHASDVRKEVPISPEVQQALETLDKAISMVRERIEARTNDKFSSNMEKELVEESLSSEARRMSRKKEYSVEPSKVGPQEPHSLKPGIHSDLGPPRPKGWNSSSRQTNQTKIVPAAPGKYGSSPPNSNGSAAYSLKNQRLDSIISRKITGNSHVNARNGKGRKLYEGKNKRSYFAACISFGRSKERCKK